MLRVNMYLFMYYSYSFSVLEISDEKYDFNILSLVFFNIKTFRLKGNTFQHSIFVTVYNYVYHFFSFI